MTAIAHFLAVTLYLAATALAVTPFARPIEPPVRGVSVLLGAGVLLHAAALASLAVRFGSAPLTGLGPALSFAGFLVAVMLLAVEVMAREVSLTLAAAPLAALVTTFGNIAGLVPAATPAGPDGVWLLSHIALSFAGIAAFATAAAAGTMYLIEHRELKSRRFGPVFRFFPPLDTLDRVNHVAIVAGWLTLTLGVVLAVTYAAAHPVVDAPKLVWGLAAWVGVTVIGVGRLARGWRARRAAVISCVAFSGVLLLYVAFRVAVSRGEYFL